MRFDKDYYIIDESKVGAKPQFVLLLQVLEIDSMETNLANGEQPAWYNVLSLHLAIFYIVEDGVILPVSLHVVLEGLIHSDFQNLKSKGEGWEDIHKWSKFRKI